MSLIEQDTEIMKKSLSESLQSHFIKLNVQASQRSLEGKAVGKPTAQLN